MSSMLTIKCLQGSQIIKYIDALAHLRIEVFKQYPYLYQGSLEYETGYLQTYINCPESFMVLVCCADTVVGASTAIPLESETDEFQKPFLEHGFNVEKIFYLGESVLLPDYRGRKIYREFFKQRELAAKRYGSKITTFCGVEREDNDSRRPADYQPLDPVWQHFGYVKQPELRAYFEWQEIGEHESSIKPMVFWMKTLHP